MDESDYRTMFEYSKEVLDKLEAEKLAAKPLADAVKKVEDRVKELHRPNSRGVYPAVTDEIRQELMKMYLDVGTEAKKLMDSDISDDVRSMTGKLGMLASRNYRTFLEYHPGKAPRPISHILEDTRTITIDLSDGKTDQVGSKQSERMAISYLNEKGENVSGVFTPKLIRRNWDMVNESLANVADSNIAGEELTEDQKKGRELIKGMFTKKWEEDKLKAPGVTKIISMGRFINRCSELVKGHKTVKAEKLKDELKELYPDVLKDDECFEKYGLTQKTLKETADTMQRFSLSININNLQAGIPDETRVDNRNAAMSTVADLMGISRVVAKASPMKMIDKNGEVVEGTFMREAKGIDTNNMSMGVVRVNENTLSGTNGQGLADVADLQVLDYICGNVDRHGGNLTYLFGPSGLFEGVQGFDNDSSFGTLVPEMGEGVNRLVGLRLLKVVSAATARKLATLTKDELAFALRGHGLSEPEIEAAGKRLEQVKNAIEVAKPEYEKLAGTKKDRDRDGNPVLIDGKIRILNRKDFAKLNNPLYLEVVDKANPKKKNLFNFLFDTITKFVGITPHRYMTQYADKYKPFAHGVTIAGGGNRSNPAGLKNESAALEKYAKKVKKNMSKGASEEFKEVQRSIESYVQKEKEIKARIDAALKAKNEADVKLGKGKAVTDLQFVFDGTVSRKDVQELRRLSKQISEKAKAYLASPASAGDDEMQKNRREVATYIKGYGDDGSKPRFGEDELMEKNDRRAVDTLNYYADRSVRILAKKDPEAMRRIEKEDQAP